MKVTNEGLLGIGEQCMRQAAAIEKLLALIRVDVPIETVLEMADLATDAAANFAVLAGEALRTWQSHEGDVYRQANELLVRLAEPSESKPRKSP